MHAGTVLLGLAVALLAGTRVLSAAPPLPVDDLNIQQLDETTLRLAWSPVDEDTQGQPLGCVEYDLHISTEAYFQPSPATFLTATGGTQLDLPLSGAGSYFQVVARSCPAPAEPEFVLVPAGMFEMGQYGASDPRWVSLGRNYLLGRTEVTNAQFLEALQWAYDQGLATVSGDYVRQHGQDLLRINHPTSDSFEIRFLAASQQFVLHVPTANWGSAGPGFAYPGGYDPAQHPVKNLSWFGAACYCDWRSQMEGLPPYYEGQWDQIPSGRNPYTAEGYRLPTEAEWERAARMGGSRTYPWGDTPPICERANSQQLGMCVGWSLPVGSLDGASMLGHQDMAGNAMEWVNDWFGATVWSPPEDPQLNPLGPASGYGRITRGGGYGSSGVASAGRWNAAPGETMAERGFRLCRTQPPPPPPGEFIQVPAGTFSMGQSEVAEPVHTVTLSRDYLLGRHEVTNAQFLEALQWACDQGLATVEYGLVRQHGEVLVNVGAMVEDRLEILFDESSGQFVLHAGTDDTIGGASGYGPGHAYPDGYDPADHPVKHVSWFGAATYCDWRSQMEGLPPYYNGQWDAAPAHDPYQATGYRLPTEAEWEHAARHADGRTFPWGDSEPSPCQEANFNHCLGWTSPVGTYPEGEGALGFQDLSGNVAEWVNDRHGDYGAGAETDPLGAATGTHRVFRGGGLSLSSYYIQSARRGFNDADLSTYAHGFRLCRTAP